MEELLSPQASFEVYGQALVSSPCSPVTDGRALCTGKPAPAARGACPSSSAAAESRTTADAACEAEPAAPRADGSVSSTDVQPHESHQAANGAAMAAAEPYAAPEFDTTTKAALNSTAVANGDERTASGIVDLRSDTVTRPTPDMRRAMAEVCGQACALALSSGRSGRRAVQLITDTDVDAGRFASVTPRQDSIERLLVVQAEVGDDVLGDDPTVKALEAAAAEKVGKEAALLVPSGTMGNLIAVLAHCSERGAEVIVGDESHVYVYEAGGMSVRAPGLLCCMRGGGCCGQHGPCVSVFSRQCLGSFHCEQRAA